MTLLMAFMIVPVSMQILSRYTGIVPRYIWTEEVARFCFVWIIMIGAMVAVREGTHFDVDLMPAPNTKREAGVSKLIVHLCMTLMAIVFAWYGAEFARFGSIQTIGDERHQHAQHLHFVSLGGSDLDRCSWPKKSSRTSR